MGDRKIFVPPRIWTKVADNYFVYFAGARNTWVEYADGNTKFGASGLWAFHYGPVESLPKGWNQVTEKRTVTR